MKKFLLLIFTLCMAFVVNAQDVPYSKYLTFTKKEFKENKFKYDDETNTWSLRKSSGLKTALNVLAIIADASEEVRPAKDDYSILVQLGKEGKAAYVQVVFYNDETYHKLLTFIKDNGKDIVDTSSGKIVKYQAFCDDYALELNMEQRIISRTSARTGDSKTLKNVDESYNKYTFIIGTDVEPWSEYLEEQAAKKAKRDAKGKKKQSVDEMM
ncbi:MAG: hypothetical protein IKV23_08625 [Bacteroidaceae bacterium]|nr:hypothetical protein [Bacteroidaceae bacterium]